MLTTTSNVEPPKTTTASPNPNGATVAVERQKGFGYIPALDGIRGMAMIMVLICHWVQSVNSVPIHGYIKYMVPCFAYAFHTGLDIFFVLSGFLITRILLGISGKPWEIGNFMARRALKIFPLYYATLIAVLVLTPAAIRHTTLRMHPDDIGLHWLWFFGQNIAVCFNHQYLYGALDHFWSVAVEEHFYWLWPLAVIFLCRRNLALMAVGLILLSLGSRCYYMWTQHDVLACEWLTICRLDGLAFGSLLAMLEAHKRLTKDLVPLLIGMFVVGVALSIGIHYDKLGPYANVLLKTFESAAFFGLIGLVVIYKDGWLGRFFKNPVLIFFGLYSYGIFVFHHFLRPPLLPVTLFYGADKPNNAAMSYGLVHLALSVGLALISYHLFEKHFLKLKNKFPAPPAPAAKAEAELAMAQELAREKEPAGIA